MGEGGTIPLMGTLQAGFPDAQLLVIGVLGPDANAHGPNEYLHLETGVRLTACAAELIIAERTHAVAGDPVRPGAVAS
jgi:hypothetical protein